MTMIERVARALCQQGGFDPDEQMPNDGPRWCYYVPGARAAIEAMRGPTPAMLIDAGTMTGYGNDSIDYRYSDENHVEWWQTMITAALTEKGEGE